MTELIEIPEVLKGRWDHLLILSYGADLPYFENVILRQDFQCRNKTILVDGGKFLQSCERYKVDGRVRFLNQRYIAEGIYVPNSAHAKIILLTTRESGKLLIGSGNLGYQGYTSGGELFTLYEYSEKDNSHLAVFQSVWDFVDVLVKREVVKGVAVQTLQALYAGTPWLMRARKDPICPVLHNLDRSFIEQLQDVLDGEKVQELWIMSPFYDPKARALEQLIATFQPKSVHLILQPKRISADPAALRRISKKLNKKVIFHPFETLSNGQSAYVHAKLYLFKTANRAICFQGSPNCSQVAMSYASPQGNIEIANLLINQRNAFDELFENLDLLPALTDLSKLEISYKEIETTQNWDTSDWLLTGASWRADSMTLYFRGKYPDLSQAKLHIGSTSFKTIVTHVAEDEVQIKLLPEAQTLLSEHLIPIILEIHGIETYPVFPCHLEILDREANTIHSTITSQDLQNFDPEDPEFIHLLRELEASFPIDRKSIWQLAGKATSNSSGDGDDEEYRLDYADIDFELLRQHPKIQQYLHGRGHGAGVSNLSRLQQLMNAINVHFSELADIAFRRGATLRLTRLDGASTSEQLEDEMITPGTEEGPPPVNRNRIKSLLKRFIKRYLRGLQSPDFVRTVGPEVIVNNYVIFSHVLWRLLQKDEWIDLVFVLDSFVRMLVFFWGNEKKSGFFAQLNKEQKIWALELVRRQKSDALLLAALHRANWQAMLMGDTDFRLRLRDFWRHILSHEIFPVEKDILLDAWVYLHDVFVLNIPSPKRVVVELAELAKTTSTSDSLDDLEARLRLQKNTFVIRSAGFFRELGRRTVQIEYIESIAQLPIHSIEDAKEILTVWMQIGKRSYHRVKFPGGFIYFDAEVSKGLYYNQDTSEEVPFSDIAGKEDMVWEKALASLMHIAEMVEKDISLKLNSAPQEVATSDGPGKYSRIK